MRNLKDIVLERLVLSKKESFNHTFEDIWEMIYKMSYHEYYLEDDDDFFEDIDALPRVKNLKNHWKQFNGWAVKRIIATGNRELMDNGPEDEDAIKILELDIANPKNTKETTYISLESDDEYYEILDDRAREILFIALKEQLS
jgi:hypothetical protein